MKIRMAEDKDIERINDLLEQVCLVHHKGRPDLFKYGAKSIPKMNLRKYSIMIKLLYLQQWTTMTVLWDMPFVFFSSI